jgi:hypothetical protein
MYCEVGTTETGGHQRFNTEIMSAQDAIKMLTTEIQYAFVFLNRVAYPLTDETAFIGI